MKKITLIIPTGYDDLLTISCIGHYRNRSVKAKIAKANRDRRRGDDR